MFNQPYSIYIDKRPMRIAFLVDSASASTEIVDRIIDYNRGLWGGRFNPIILTDGHTIEDKWWKFLCDIDPDVVKPLLSLNIELLKRFDNFLSPLTIEQFWEDEQSNLRVQMRSSNEPAGININSLNFSELGVSYEEPTLGIFNLDEMNDEIAELFVLRNFGTYESINTTFRIGSIFRIPQSLETLLEQGKVPTEVHEEFKKAGISLSQEAFSKQSVQRPGSWAIIDGENKEIYYVSSPRDRSPLPITRSFKGEFREIKKNKYLVTDRKSLADTLLELSHTRNIVFHDQVCALPNTERESEVDRRARCFEVIVGDTLQDLVYFWNRPLLLPRSERKYQNQMWLPTDIAKDADMEKALYTWIDRGANLGNQNPKTVRFVSFSTEKQELEEVASRFRENPRVRHRHVRTVTDCFEEPQIPKFRPENPLPFQQEAPLFSRENSIDIHRVQGNKGILELTEPKGITQRGLAGHWMIDFYVEFTHDMYEDNEYVIKMPGKTLFWRFPNRNHLMHGMFNKSSRVKRNGFPSVMMQRDKKVLRFTLREAESIVASLFYSDNRPVNEYSDPRDQAAAKPYYSVEISDKGKYLQGVLGLFGNLTFADQIFSNPYWLAMFDGLSKNTRAEQSVHEAVANRLKKEIGRSNLIDNQVAIESIAKLVVNEAKKLYSKQKEFPFDEFMQEAEQWRKEYIENVEVVGAQSEMDIIDFGFRREDVKIALAQLTRRNIIQIGIKPRCPSCGIVNWYHVDDISQHLICQGCRIQFPLHPEPTWHYRLNELIQAAHAQHGTTPVILVLAQLLEESRTSFLFSPNLVLLTEPQDASSEKLDKAAEVDIACIQDGKFIIGEVKQSASLFRKKDFDAIANIAERTKPDRVLFSCMDSRQPTNFIDSHIEKIRAKLSPLEIDVKWYELKYLDYADSVW